MKQADSNVRRLGEIRETEGVVPFLLAIFRGEANINEKVGSRPLVEKYFDAVYRAGDPAASLLLQEQQRFRCLVVLGASTRSIVRKYYQGIIADISRQLNKLTAALECPELFAGRTVLLKGLLRRLEALAETIDDSRLLGDDSEEGDVLDELRFARPPANRAELDREIYLTDRWSFLLNILLWSPSTRAGLRAKPARVGLLREFRQRLTEVMDAIIGSGLTDGMEAVPTPWEIQIARRRAISEATSLTGAIEGDCKLIQEQMRKLLERLERGEQPEDWDTSFDLFG